MTDDRRCTGYDVESRRPCPRAAARHVKAGCVHEHTGTHRLCLAHTGDLGEGRMQCGACLEVDGHHCTLTPLDPAEAAVSRRDVTREILGQLGPVDEHLLNVLAGDHP